MPARPCLAAMAAAFLMSMALPCAAGPRLDDLRGHLAIGFSRVSTSDTSRTPPGSLSLGVGLDQPVGRGLRVGLDVGYHLLGSRTLVQGTLTSGLDYSVFEALALLHWSPGGRGPQLVVSGGPGLFLARASLAATSVGAAFAPQAIHETRPGGSLGVTVTGRRAAPVRVGLEAGLRVIPLETRTWTLLTARIAMLY